MTSLYTTTTTTNTTQAPKAVAPQGFVVKAHLNKPSIEEALDAVLLRHFSAGFIDRHEILADIMHEIDRVSTNTLRALIEHELSGNTTKTGIEEIKHIKAYGV